MPYKDKSIISRKAKEKMKTLEGWASVRYNEMKCRCGKRPLYKNIKITLSKEDFLIIVKNSDWHKLKIPSVDRINPKGNYSLNNIQIIEKSENSRRATTKHIGCIIDGCGNRHFGNGFCMKHYTRYVRRGTRKDITRFGETIRK